MIACQTELDCLYCGTSTPHTVVYASLYIKRITCHRCACTFEKRVPVLIWQYCCDLPERAFALTRRLKGEAVSHPMQFASRLPGRMVHKPIELSREFVELCL